MRAIALVLACGLCASPLAAQQCPDGTPPPCTRPAVSAPRPAAPPAPLSIAVLPFSSRSPDTSQAYLAEGMADEIANQLTRVARLQVKARTLVAAQWRRTPDPFDAARRLNVAWFVHGSVRQAGPQLLVSVQLVRATTGEESWARRFPRRADDVFAVQTEVAESVAAQVGGRLNQQDRVALARRPTRSDEAYRLYLRGNALMKRRTEGEVAQALAAYREAVRLDPRFADAWARVGFAMAIQFVWLGWRTETPRDSLLPLARAAAERALELDSVGADAWMALGTAKTWGGDLPGARASFERALRLDSLNAEAWLTFGNVYSVYNLNDHGRAEQLLRRAIAIDPDSRNAWRTLGVVLSAQGRFAEAEAVLDTTLSLGPWQQAFLNRAVVRYLRGDGAGALADLAESERLPGRLDLFSDAATERRFLALENLRPHYVMGNVRLTRALYRVALGDSTGARAVLDSLLAERDTSQTARQRTAIFAMALGRRAEVRAVVESLPAGLGTWVFLHLPHFIPLRSDPRFIRAMEASRPQVPWSW
jgi:TolB-like protein/tetratricopeptide (TPR) repeat protein